MYSSWQYQNVFTLWETYAINPVLIGAGGLSIRITPLGAMTFQFRYRWDLK